MKYALAALVAFICVLALWADGPDGQEFAPGPQMTRRAEIRVTPMDVVEQHRAQDAALVADLRTMLASNVSLQQANGDARVRQHLMLESQLAQAVLNHLDRDSSDAGKTATSLAVQKKLNAMEGRANCGACHSGVGMQMELGRMR